MKGQNLFLLRNISELSVLPHLIWSSVKFRDMAVEQSVTAAKGWGEEGRWGLWTFF